MGSKVAPIKYVIVINNYTTGESKSFTYGTYEEAINYYVVYVNSYKNTKIELYALLSESYV